MAEVTYSAEIDAPVLFEQGRPTTLRCPLRRNGVIVAPSSGTVTIYDASNTAVVSAAAVTITDGVATYATGAFASSTRSMGWRIEWSLTVGGVVRLFRSTAGLVKCVPSPMVSDQTIHARVPVLDSTHPSSISRSTTHQPAIDDAWKGIRRMLARGGNRHHLVVDASDLEEPHLLLTLSRIFAGLGVIKPEHLETSKRYEKDVELAWADVQLSYDFGDDGVVDRGRKSASGSLWLCGR